MNVFVTGGTGALGRPTIQRLLEAGHHVRALAHTDDAAQRLAALGAEPVRGSLFDPEAMRAALNGMDALLHLATRIPVGIAMRRPRAWDENDRIRTEGMRVLVDAALTAGVHTVIYPSVTFVYPDSGDVWIDAASTAPERRGANTDSTLDAEAEVARVTEAGGRGIVLRMGRFYGDDVNTRTVLTAARWGFALQGDDSAYESAIWTDDAAAAVVAALDARVPVGVYDVVDDEPLTHAEVRAVLARATGRTRVRRLPLPVVRAALGQVAQVVTRSQRVSNRRFREVSRWRPAVPSAREGFARLAALHADRRQQRGPVGAVRPLLGALTLVAAGAGLWQLVWPRSFYDSFPGFGHVWVSPDGPFNEHLMRDAGSGNVALAVVTLLALWWPSATTVRIAALATLAASLPHLAYHLVHIDALPVVGDQIAQTLSLFFQPVAALVLLRLAGGLGRRRSVPVISATTAAGEAASTPLATGAR